MFMLAVLSLCVTPGPGIPACFMQESFPWHQDPLPCSAIRILGSGTSQEEPRAVHANSSDSKQHFFKFFFFKMKLDFRKFLT